MPPFVPAEHIIASLVAFFTFLSFPLPASLIHRVPQSPSRKASDNTSLSTILAESIPKSLDSVYRHHVLRSIGAVGIGAVLWFAYISGWGSWPFDRQHPKRIFISFTEDVSISLHPCFDIHMYCVLIRPRFRQVAMAYTLPLWTVLQDFHSWRMNWVR
jgi:hypothetical protein